MNPVAVNISGTYTEKNRPNNGMERVAGYLNAHRLERIPLVGFCEWHTHGESRTGEKVAVVLPAVEPGITPDGGPVPGLPVQDGYPTDAAGQIFWLLDSIRRSQGKGAVADTLFGNVDVDLDDDGPDDQLPGQTAIDVVPPPSGEEITADLDERREAKKQAAAKKTAAPAAAFTAPGGDA